MNNSNNINKKKINLREIDLMKASISGLGLNTICTEALCPNISECYGKKQATFLILGKTCTRSCSFCNVSKGTPIAVDNTEPFKVAEAVKLLRLKHVVITSPTRDDIDDGGASIFCEKVFAKSLIPALL
jgi:lipoic acid synthetase